MRFAPAPLPDGRGSVCGPSHATGLNRRGFTLAELMVSVAVLLILMTMVGWIFSTATRASSVATAHNESMGLTRAFQTQLASDFGARVQKDALGKSTFIGIWYQLTPDPRYAGSTPTRYLRTDRIVFYTMANDMVRQEQPTNAKISGTARVFYGHENGVLNQPDVEKWTLARRQKISAPILPTGYPPYPSSYYLPANGMDASFVSSGYSEQKKLWDGVSDLCDNWECEPYSLEYWRIAPVEAFFFLGGSGSYPGLMVQNPTTATVSWIRRPVVNTTSDYTRQTGMQMCFLPGCAEFKVQRWIERDAITGASLGMAARWYPEEDLDGNGLVESVAASNDFALMATDGVNVREYFNGPSPATAKNVGDHGLLVPTNPRSTPYFNGTDGWWLYYPEQDMPKAIKVTIRLYDQNKRIPDGQVLTMTFGLAGAQY